MGKLKFYRDEPLFGLDIGHSELKVVQVTENAAKQTMISGYGISEFDPTAIENGVITKPKAIAEAMHALFENRLVGAITSRRVACSLPTSRTFNRPMKVPPMDHQAIMDAIHLEAEQYIPIPINNLYLDYEISHQDDQGIELTLVAASKNIVDSYHTMLDALQLEPVVFEPSINAASRLVHLQADAANEPVIVVDIGAVTTDIAVYDKALLVASTVSSGGEDITKLIIQTLHLNYQQASDMKREYGIAYSEKQQRIIDATKPALDTLVHEIEKSIRYYRERAAKSDRQISQIITVGGGSVMPGLNQFLSRELQLPTQNLDPWEKIRFGNLPQPNQEDKAMYIVATGEAIIKPSEILQ